MKTKVLLACLFALFAVSAFSQDAARKPGRSNTEPLKVGEKAPDFTLNDETEEALSLSRQKQPVVLVFYRGYW